MQTDMFSPVTRIQASLGRFTKQTGIGIAVLRGKKTPS